MPALSCWAIRSSFLHLLGGALLGGMMLWQKGPGGLPGAYGWLGLHIHLMMIGWIVQLSVGVAYWILPRFATAGDGGAVRQRRGREPLAVAAVVLLNGSTGMGLLGGAEWGPVGAMALAAGGAAAFAAHAWPRVKPFLAQAGE